MSAHIEHPSHRLRLADRLLPWFPVALLAGLAMLTYWLDAQVQHSTRAAQNPAPIADYFVEQFSATQFGKDGKVLQQLSAAKLEHFATAGISTTASMTADGESVLTAPRLTYSQPNQAVMRLAAAGGRILNDGQEVQLTGQVVVLRDADATHSAARIESEALRVFPKIERVVAEQTVRLADGAGTVTAGAMNLDYKVKKVEFSNGVSGQILPRKNLSKTINARTGK